MTADHNAARWEISPARDGEYAEIGELTVRAYLPSGMPLTDPYYAELRDVAGRAETSVVLVARSGGRPVGTVTWCPPGLALTEVAAAQEAEIRMLAVDPRWQGQGIGRALLAACVQLAVEADAKALVLSTAPWMVRAHTLYHRAGFCRLPHRDWSVRPDIRLACYGLTLVAGGALAGSGGGPTTPPDPATNVPIDTMRVDTEAN